MVRFTWVLQTRYSEPACLSCLSDNCSEAIAHHDKIIDPQYRSGGVGMSPVWWLAQGNDGDMDTDHPVAGVPASGPVSASATTSPRRPTQHRLLIPPRVPLGSAPRPRMPSMHRVNLMRTVPSAELLQTTRLQWDSDSEVGGGAGGGKATPTTEGAGLCGCVLHAHARECCGGNRLCVRVGGRSVKQEGCLYFRVRQAGKGKGGDFTPVHFFAVDCCDARQMRWMRVLRRTTMRRRCP